MLSASGVMNLELDLDIEDGELIGIYGDSGAGKTTMLRILAGMEKPDNGHIIFNDETWNDSRKNIFLAPQKRKTGFVFQDYALFPNMTIRENIAFGVPAKNAEKGVDDLLELMDLSVLANSSIHKLSGGQRQRVALARALASEPKLFLLDEPLSALDEELRARLLYLIADTHKKNGITTIIVSHNLADIYAVCNRILLLKNGRIVSQSKNENASRINSDTTIAIPGRIISIQRSGDLSKLEIAYGANILKLELNDPGNLKTGDWIEVSSRILEPTIKKIE